MAIHIIGEYDIAYSRLVREATDGFWMSDQVLANFSPQFSDHAGPLRNVPGKMPLDQPLQSASYTAPLSIDCVRETNVDDHTKFIADLANAQQEAIAPSLFGSLIEVAEAVGNSVDAREKSFNEAFLEMVENMDIPFDENGDHNLQVVVNPSTGKRLEEQGSPTPEQTARYNEIISRKKAEFYAKKRSRRLSRPT